MSIGTLEIIALSAKERLAVEHWLPLVGEVPRNKAIGFLKGLI